MVKSKPNYLIVFLMFLTAAGATHWIRSRADTVLFDADPASMPIVLGTWTGEDAQLAVDTQSALEADEVLYRRYVESSELQPLDFLVVYRKYGRRGFVHRPEMCYPAAGWEIVHKSYTTVPYGGRDIQSVKIVAQKDQEQEVIVYWFASGDQVEANFVKQQIRMAMDRLHPRKYGWAFIRISSPVVVSEEETMRHIREFVKTASEPLTDTLTGAHSQHLKRVTR